MFILTLPIAIHVVPFICNVQLVFHIFIDVLLLSGMKGNNERSKERSIERTWKQLLQDVEKNGTKSMKKRKTRKRNNDNAERGNRRRKRTCQRASLHGVRGAIDKSAQCPPARDGVFGGRIWFLSQAYLFDSFLFFPTHLNLFGAPSRSSHLAKTGS